MAAGERVSFGLNADVAKAHRRVKVREEDWGVLACKTSAGADVVWLNITGTFGVTSAAYWWSRLMGLVGRFALNAMLDDWFFALIFVDDMHMASCGGNRWLSLWRFITVLEMAGLPFSPQVQRRLPGGLCGILGGLYSFREWHVREKSSLACEVCG